MPPLVSMVPTVTVGRHPTIPESVIAELHKALPELVSSINLLKVRVETLEPKCQPNLANIMKNVIRREGVSNFYRDLLPSFLNIMPFKAIGLTVYDKYKYLAFRNLEISEGKDQLCPISAHTDAVVNPYISVLFHRWDPSTLRCTLSLSPTCLHVPPPILPIGTEFPLTAMTVGG